MKPFKLTVREQVIDATIPPSGDKGKETLPIRVTYGKSWPEIAIPEGTRAFGGVAVSLDWYNDKLQACVHDNSAGGDACLLVRCRENGTIAEIIVRDDLMRLVKLDSGPTTEWQKERDANTRGEGEPSHDDSVKYCPDCETPNQFGEVCSRCAADREAERQPGFDDKSPQ